MGLALVILEADVEAAYASIVHVELATSLMRKLQDPLLQGPFIFCLPGVDAGGCPRGIERRLPT